MSRFHLLCLVANLVLLNGQPKLPSTLDEYRRIMSDPVALKELKDDLLSKGILAEVFENKDAFDGMLVLTFLNYACNIEKYLPGAVPVHERVDPKTDCCKRLFVLDCVIDKSDEPMRDSIKVDSVHCNDFLIDPRECDLHIRQVARLCHILNFDFFVFLCSDFKRVQLKSIACYNDVVQTFGRQFQSCCIQNFQSQCFTHNFVADCRKVLTKQGPERCDKLAKVEDHCRNFQGCPVYHVKTFNKSFFTSRIFMGSVILLATLFAGFYFICQRCNQPDTSFEIARGDSKAKAKKENEKEKGSSRSTPSTKNTRTDKVKRKTSVK